MFANNNYFASLNNSNSKSTGVSTPTHAKYVPPRYRLSQNIHTPASFDLTDDAASRGQFPSIHATKRNIRGSDTRGSDTHDAQAPPQPQTIAFATILSNAPEPSDISERENLNRLPQGWVVLAPRTHSHTIDPNMRKDQDHTMRKDQARKKDQDNKKRKDRKKDDLSSQSLADDSKYHSDATECMARVLARYTYHARAYYALYGDLDSPWRYGEHIMYVK